MRKLASIREITNIRPIEGKDLIVQVNVDGWNVIVKKDEFKEGDLCVYMEIDSKLPPRPEFAFLERKNYTIKTMKMAGVRSEGIVFPMSILPRGKYKLGDDVTQKLKITQYNAEPEDKETLLTKLFDRMMRYVWFRTLALKFLRYGKLSKKAARSTFPSWINKTDEERIQNKTRVLKDDTIWTATEKLDGSSATFGLRKNGKDFEYVVCSRNHVLLQTDNVWHTINETYGMRAILEELWKFYGATVSLVIQGEVIGPNIQGNKYKLKEIEFHAFNLVVDRKRYDVRDNGLLKCVPVMYDNISIKDKTVDEILQMETFESSLRKENQPSYLAEGLVFRSYDENGLVLDSFKAVSPDFLMKNKE